MRLSAVLLVVGCAQADETSDASRIVYPRGDAAVEAGIDDAGVMIDGASFDDASADAMPPAANCDDNMRNQDETGVDCGGTTCRPCDHCDTCDSEDGCPDAMTCIDGRCVQRRQVTVDWLQNCVLNGSNDFSPAVVVSGMPAGEVELTAISGGGTPWSASVHDPPTRGYAYRVTCDPLDTSGLATPEGIYYATAEQAFAALEVSSVRIAHQGGNIQCYQPDSGCTDNSGSVVFSIQSVCSVD